MTNSKNQINQDSPRIKNRDSELQKNRDSLAENLTKLRSKWDVGKMLATNKLKKVKQEPDYLLDRYWYTKILAEKLIEAWAWESVVENLENFEWLDHKEIAEKLIEAWRWGSVARHLEKFEWLDHKEIAEKLIEVWEWESVENNLEKFKL